MGNCFSAATRDVIMARGTADAREQEVILSQNSRRYSCTEPLATMHEETQEDSALQSKFPPVTHNSTKRVPQAESAYYVLRKTEDVSHKYYRAEELGQGQFGVVSVGIEKSTGHKVAIKTMNKRRTEARDNRGKDIRTEVEILYHLGGHQNIVKLIDVFEDEDSIHLIMELCQGGNWFERLLTHGTYSEAITAVAARTLLETLAFCHSLGVVHRDIKPENILYTDHSPESPMKFADFGLSALLPQASEDGLLFDPVGSTYYVAPEVLKEQGYGKECDIWSLGVVLYVTLGGYPPFDGPSEQKVFSSIMYKPLRFNDPTWAQISPGAKDFIGRMLCKNPNRRATIKELLAHPWLASASSNGTGIRAPKAADTPVPDAVVNRLQHFSAMNRFKKEARKVLASILPEEEVMGMLGIFKEMDHDKDGVITLDELRAAIASKGIRLPRQEAKELLHCMDLNGDGVIDYEEFLAATVHQQRLDKDELRFKAFQHFDTDHSGFITEQELRDALGPQATHLNLEAILQAIDTDHDGRINYEEFCHCLRARESESGLGTLSIPESKVAGLVNIMSGRFNSGRKFNGNATAPAASTQRKGRMAQSGRRKDNAFKSSTRTTEPGHNRVHFKESPEVSTIHEIDQKRARSETWGAAMHMPGASSMSSQSTPARREQKLMEVLKSSSRLISGSEALGIRSSRQRSKGAGLGASRGQSFVRAAAATAAMLAGSPSRHDGLHVAVPRGRPQQLREPRSAMDLIRDASPRMRGARMTDADDANQVPPASIFPPIRLPNSIVSRPGSCTSSVKHGMEDSLNQQVASTGSSMTSVGSRRSGSRSRPCSRRSSRGLSPRSYPSNLANAAQVGASARSNTDAGAAGSLWREDGAAVPVSAPSQTRLLQVVNRRLQEVKATGCV